MRYSPCYKHRLVIQICSASKRTCNCNVCTQRTRCRWKPRFVDWYLLLGVEDDADIDVIRKTYRKLALQVHPDKNDHPEAEIAFRLILEAYKCLSDAARRIAFDAEKRNNACPGCLRLSLHRPSREDEVSDSHKLKNVGDRFREEARVIETCMRSYAETKTHGQCSRDRTVSSEKMGSPVFDPSRYEFSGYPHVRSRVGIQVGVGPP